jgi:H+/Cl- antiporter ClcA
VESHEEEVPQLRLVINSIYVAGAISSLLIGAFGVFIITAILIVSPDMLPFGAVLGLPIIVICISYLSFVIRLLFSKEWQQRRYRTRSWILALLGVCVMWIVALFVFFATRGV